MLRLSELLTLGRLVFLRLDRAFVRCLALVLGSSVELASVVSLPLLTGHIIDALRRSHSGDFRRALMELLAALVLRIGTASALTLVGAGWEERIGRRLRSDLAAAILGAAGPNRQIEVGDSSARLTSDCQRVQESLRNTFLYPLMDVLCIGVTIGIILQRAPLIGVASLLASPVGMLVSRRLAGRLEQNVGLSQQQTGALMQTVNTWFSQGQWVRLFDISAVALQQIDGRVDRLRELGVQAASLRARLAVTALASMAVPHLAILSLGGSEVLAGRMSIGSLVTLLGLSGLITPPLQRLVVLFSLVLPNVLPSSRRLQAPLGAQRDRRRPPTTAGAIRRLEVRGVMAGDGRPETQIVSVPELSCDRGQLVGICGSNGSGKTTFARALAGLTSHTGSAFAIGTHESRALTPDDVAFLPADPVLFPGSRRDNVALFRDAMDRDEDLMLWACSGKPDDLVLEEGAGMSRGEQQKVGIGRTLCLERPIVILDEPSIGLDDDSVDELVRLLERACQHSAIILISHDERLLAKSRKIYRSVSVGSSWELREARPARVAATRAADAVLR